MGYDRGVGGTELDRRLRELLIADIQRKHKVDIRDDKKAMSKLWKESTASSLFLARTRTRRSR